MLLITPSSFLHTLSISFYLFFFNDTATTEIYTLSLHDALPIFWSTRSTSPPKSAWPGVSTMLNFTPPWSIARSEEHTSELQSRQYLVCRLLLEKKKKKRYGHSILVHRKHGEARNVSDETSSAEP